MPCCNFADNFSAGQDVRSADGAPCGGRIHRVGWMRLRAGISEYASDSGIAANPAWWPEAVSDFSAWRDFP